MLAFSPDGKYLAAGGQQDDSITVFEVKTGKKAQTVTPKGAEVTGLAFSPDSKWVGAVATDGRAETLQFYEIASGKAGVRIDEERVNGFPEKSAMFPKTGGYLTGGGIDQVRLYGVRKGREKDVPFVTPSSPGEKDSK
jgi:WD40 repeat protein